MTKKQLLSAGFIATVAAVGIAFAAPAKADGMGDADKRVKVAPSKMSQSLKLEIGGFMEQWLGWADNDETVFGSDVQSIDQQSDTEVYFMGSAKLDNGIDVGVMVQLEGNTSFDQIDESYGYVESKFGKIVLGSENSAAYLMQVASPDFGIGINGDGDTRNVGDQANWILPVATMQGTGFAGGATPLYSTFVELGDDDGQKITYFTPRFSGFQFGVSYVPDADMTGGDINAMRLESTAFHNGFSLGGNYMGQVGSVDVALALGYQTISNPDAVAYTGIDDPKAWNAGLRLGFGGFSIGTSYAAHSDGVVLTALGAVGTTAGTAVRSTEGDAWEIGAGYETGPFGVSINYITAEVEDTALAGDNKQQTYSVSGKYALGAGVSLVGTVGHASFEDEEVSAENEGAFVVLGTVFKF